MMKRTYISRAFVLATTLSLGACGDGGGGSGGSSPTAGAGGGTVTAAKLDVTPCLTQTVGGRSVASLVVPDVLTLDPTQPSGFPNGRRLQDPVVDLEIAALFLDLKTDPVDTLAKLPLDPSGNDVPLPATFPYLGAAHGGVTTLGSGSGFVFRTDPATAYTRVDRMGEPAVATVLVSTANKTAFNDDSPTQDATGKWAPEFTTDLTALATALQDDLTAAGLKICAVPKTS
jgi:hypothetical protein